MGAELFAPGLLRARRALVTGGGTGIGLAIAETLGRLGAQVRIAARTLGRLQSACERLRGLGVDCDCDELNIRDPEAVARLFARLQDEDRLPDILVNNAGGQFEAAAVDISANGFRSVIDLNLNGTWHMCSEFGRRRIQAGLPGAIVNIVLCCDCGLPGMAHAAAARAGAINLTRTLAIEWGPHAIRVNAVAPGTIATAALDQYDAQLLARGIGQLPIGRMGEPAEVADAVVYLVSPLGAYVTGSVLQVDGGEHLLGAGFS